MTLKQPIVLDASITAKWIFEDEKTVESEELLEAVLREDIILIQPAIWAYEVLNLIKTGQARDRITQQKAQESVGWLQTLSFEIVGLEKTDYAELLTLAMDHQLTAYDAAYFLTAQRRGINLVTEDGALLALKRQHSWIHSLRDFRRRRK